MKVLIKGHAKDEGNSVIILKDPEKQKEMLRLLTVRDYARAIEYAQNCGSRTDVFRGKKEIFPLTVDLVLTPRSVHWDLMKN